MRMEGSAIARIKELTSQILVEQDREKFELMVQELNRLLDGEIQQRRGKDIQNSKV